MAKGDREVPYCTIFLVVGALTCHSLVLAGNIATSRAMRALGQSTHGWSTVGIGLADSLVEDLDHIMSSTTSILTSSIQHIQQFQGGLDAALGLTGGLSDGILALYAPAPAPSPPSLLALQVALTPPSRRGAGIRIGEVTAEGGAAAAAKLQGASHGRQLPVNASGILGQGSSALSGLVDSILRNASRSIGVELPANITEAALRGELPSPAQIRQPLVEQMQHAVQNILAHIMPLLHRFFDMIRPALDQIGQWLISFGERIRSTIETFSGTIDRVQGIFNQLMSHISADAGHGEEQMLYDTFTIFDASNTGFISAQDLHDVANMFSLSALQGQVADELFERYDADHDGQIQEPEFALLVHDDQIPGAMAMVLRTYARQLAVIAGTVAGARLRDEVASAVVDYFTLVCSKNMTKVGWVSQTLTNESVPIEFTADILKQLAENEDNPVQLTTADVGEIVITEMCRLNAPYVGRTLVLLTDPAFWVAEGFDLNQQPAYVEKVVRWVTMCPNSAEVFANVPAYAAAATPGSNWTQTIPMMARNQTLAAVQRYRSAQPAPANHYTSGCSLHLRDTLLGGIAASAQGNDPAAQRASNSGVPARPETLLFAARLAANASETAARFQAQASAYSGTSSGALDNFANQVQNMLQRIMSFLNTMEEYATPTGIQRIEEMVTEFATHAANDVAGSVVGCIDQQLETRLPGQLTGQPPVVVAVVSNVFGTLTEIMTSLQTILPSVVNNLKFARNQVSATSNTINTTFVTFRDQGPPIFYKISALYRTIWTAYFVLFATMTVSVLFYGFWASGWFGGPQATHVEAYEPPQTFRERCGVCCASCGACMRACHDSSMCFWSVALLMQVIVLIMFVISIVLCLLAGIKAFLSAGCGQVYILNDDTICTGTIGTIRQWLHSFLAAGGIPLDMVCNENQLRTCELIGSRLKNSALMTVIGSILAAVLTFQMIIESAIMHERARWRRMFDEESKKV